MPLPSQLLTTFLHLAAYFRIGIIYSFEGVEKKAMAWIYLIAAGLLEIAWAIGLKYTEGWTRPVPSLVTAILMVASFFLLSQALLVIPIGTGYAVWTGIGAVGTAIIGMLLFNESREIGRIICIFLIVMGIIGLKLFPAEN